MRACKIIIGLGCFVVAIIPTLLVLGEWDFFFNVPFALFALGLIFSGGFLIARRNTQLSMRERYILGTAVCLLAVFFLAFVVPHYVAVTRVRNANSCVNNLRQIESAKEQWALENGKKGGDFVTENDIKPYIKLDSNGNLPKCPKGGAYMIGRLGEDPKCSIGNADWPNTHALSYTDGGWWKNVRTAYIVLFGFKPDP